MMEEWTTGSDLRLALRLIGKRPLLNLTAFLALAVGIGIANAGFTFIDAIAFSQLPYEGGHRFFSIDVSRSEDGRRTRLDPRRFRLMSDEAHDIDYLGGFRSRRFNVARPSGQVDLMLGAALTPDAFRIVPVRPLAGRLLVESDGAAGAPPVALIRESLWDSRFGRRSQVLGSTIEVDGVEHLVVGVLPDSFEFPNAPHIWVPLDRETLGGDPTAIGADLFGVLAPRADWGAAQRQIEELSVRYEASTPSAPRLDFNLRPFTHESNMGEVWMLLGSLVAVLVVVLLVIASNVGNLIMVRTSLRAGELAVRSALGAARGRLVGQLFLEVSLLVAAAAVFGFVLSNGILASINEILHRQDGDAIPFWISLSPSLRTTLAVIVVAFLASLAAGLLPALKATRGETTAVLKESDRGGGSLRLGRLGSAVTILQMALSVALVGAALVPAHGALRYLDFNLDLPTDRILTAWVRMGAPSTPVDDSSPPERRSEERQRAVIEAIAHLESVRSVGAASGLPGRSTASLRLCEIEQLAGEPARPAAPMPVESVRPGYLTALGAVPVAGRFFDARDTVAGAVPVAVVNQPFVERFLGGKNPLGRRLRMVAHRDESQEPEWREIVGVVQDLGLSVADPSRAAGYYVPMTPSRHFYLAMRIEGRPDDLIGPLRQAVAQADPTVSLRRLRLLKDGAEQEVFALSVLGGGIAALGGAALLLSLVGMFTMTSLTVTQRTREIGIRRALGATPGRVLAVVSRRAALHLLIGAVVGVGLGALLMQASQVISTTLPPTGLRELPAVAALLTLSGLVACALPARRALRVNPSEALRGE